MPTKRLLYTFGEIKELLARIHNVCIQDVSSFENKQIDIELCQGSMKEVDDDTYLIQVTKQ